MTGIWASPRLGKLVERTDGHIDGDLRTGTPLDHCGQEDLGAYPFTRRRIGMGCHSSENVLCSCRQTFDPHQHPEKEADVRPFRPGGFGNLGDPANDGGHFALFEDFGSPGHDDVEGALPIPRLEGGTRVRSSDLPWSRCQERGLVEQIRLRASGLSARSLKRSMSRKRWWKRNHWRRVSRGTRNIDSRSSCSRRSCGLASPVRRVTSSAHIVSSTERRSRNSRRSSGWARRTSSLR